MPWLRSALAAAALIALAGPAAAQNRSGVDIFLRVAARTHERNQGVQNYTVNAKTVGTTVVSYVSRAPDGTFQVQAGGTGPMAEMVSGMAGWGDALRLLLENVPKDLVAQPGDEEAVTYEGVVTSGGVPAHRLAVVLPDSAAPADGDMPRRFAVDFDTATLLMRRMEVDMTTPGGPARGMVMELSDWRTVQGVTLPFHRHLVVRGMRAEALGADTANAGQTLAQGRAMLAGLPKDQQEAMRQVLEMMEGLVKRDEMVLDEIVVSVAVNQGPPRGVTLGPVMEN